MVQILEDQPSFASQLLRGGMQTGTAIGKELLGEYLSKNQKQKQAKALKDLSGIDVSGLSPEVVQEFSKALGKSMGESRGKGFGSTMENENRFFKDKYGVDLSEISDPNTRKVMINSAIKSHGKQEEKQEALAGVKDSLDWLEDNIQYSGKHGVNPKWGGIEAQGKEGALGIINPETGKQFTNLELNSKREEIDRTGIWVADAIYTHFNKGVLNKEKWNDVKEQFATKSDLPASMNRARMAAAKRIMKLPSDAPPPVVNKVIKSELKSLDKIKKSKGNSSEKGGKTRMKSPNGQIVEMDSELAEEALQRNTGWQKE